jgi:hypothetical protein
VNRTGNPQSEESHLTQAHTHPDIFISHSHLDTTEARLRAAEWEEWGFGVKADFLDDKLVKASKKGVMTSKLADHLRSIILPCRLFVFLVSKNSAKSGWTPWELGLAHGATGRVHLYLLEPNALEAFDENKREYLRLYEEHQFSAGNAREYLERIVGQARFETFSPAQLAATADAMRDTLARVREQNASELARLFSVGSGQVSGESTKIASEETVNPMPQFEAALNAIKQMQEAIQEAFRSARKADQ